MFPLLFLLFCSNQPSTTPNYSEQYRAHVRFLADDLLEGRETAKRGQKLAAAYLAAQLAASGAEPAFPDSNTPYYQTFDISVHTVTPKELILKEGDVTETVSYGADFSLYSEGNTDPNISGDMVFVGFGMDAESYSDYAGMDVTDKWVVIIDGDPEVKGLEFSHGETSFWGRLKIAREKGARGVIYLNDESYGSDEPSRSMELPVKEQQDVPFRAVLFVGPHAHGKVMGAHFEKIEAAMKQVREEGKVASFAMENRQAFLVAENKSELAQTENVVAILPGSDPKLRHEYLVLSAHYDHEGIKSGEVYNGADDNASGTSTLLMLAESLRDLSRRRSLIILLLTAEEKGLLGSEYFVAHPIVPIDQIVGNINVDMIGRSADGRLGVIPAKEDRSSLADVAEKVNRSGGFGMTFRYDMDRYHHRSDHFNFVQAGVPAVFFFTGVHDDYHRPGDDWEKLKYDEMARFFRFFQSYVMNVLNNNRPPSFTETDGEKTTSG